MRTRSRITTKDDINWYYEQDGSGPHIVLIPDGFGECHMFDKPMSLIASAGFTVTTFDMPGMSRSSDAPLETYQDVTAQKLAKYVIGICDALNIQTATFFGCSSGASTVLALVADYPDRVRSALPHEAPTYDIPELAALHEFDDETIADTLASVIVPSSVGSKESWESLGDESLARLRKNYVRWARGYPRTIPGSTPTAIEDINKRPLDWTVGASTLTEAFFDNIVTATKAGVPVGVIPGRHFPYVTDPEAFAEYIVRRTKKYL